MRPLLLFILLTIAISVSAQRYNSSFIIGKADSILLANVGDTLFKYFNYTYNTGSFYSYYDNHDKLRTHSLLLNKKTKVVFVNANVRYVFNYPELRGVSGATFVSMNDKFELIKPINLEYIPDFVRKGKPSNFITINQASKILFDSLNYKGIDIKGPFLRYQDDYIRYIYSINNIISKEVDRNGHESGYEEIIIIDAIDGKILYHEKVYYGLIIR